ncbi:MAG: class I SAM-dependent methyltransferase [Rhodobacteraceae bacterium]|nr:class I SAM-dependent methyltransferase [Paracoccaceae bacterium]
MSHVDRLALAVETGALPLPDDGTVVVLRAAPSRFLSLMPPERLLCEQGFRPLHDALSAENLPVLPVVERASAGLVVVNCTRSRAETLGNVARGFAMLPPGGLLALNGGKTDGVDSLARQIAKAVPQAGSYVKAHGRVAWFERPEELPPELRDWAEAACPAPTVSGHLTAPGMFSPDAPDPGSQLLAESFGPGLTGRVADLGAGWGWLADACLKACPGVSELDLYEAEYIALEAAQRNVTDPRARFHWADVTKLGKGTSPYDVVICNPPFHQGRAAEPALGIAFIAAAARILKVSGRFLMVANRQLPYEAALDAAFSRWERLHETRSFKVISATHPRRT